MNKAASVWGRHASAAPGGGCKAPAPHRPALVPPYKRDGGPWRGAKRTPGLRELPDPMRVAFPCRAGMGMQEMLYGMGVWTMAPAGWEGRRSTGPKANTAGEQGGGNTQWNQANLEGFAFKYNV